MRKKLKQLIGILLTLVMALGQMPGMSLTALAWDGDPYASLLNTTAVVKFDNKDWYLIENNSTALNAGTVTLLSKECVAASNYNNNGSSYTYEGSTVETAVNTYYNGSISSGVKSAVVDNKMFLLTENQAKAMTDDTRKCTQFPGTLTNYWWLCSPGLYGSSAACVGGDDGGVDDNGCFVNFPLGVRPALKLNLSSVIFESSSNTFTVSSANDPYASLKNTTTVVKFDDKDWYLIDYDSSTVTLLSKECVGASAFGNNKTYSGSTVEAYVNNWYKSKISTGAKTAVNGSAFLLTIDQATTIRDANANVLKCSKASSASHHYWWLCSPGSFDGNAACVRGDNGDVIGFGSLVGETLGVRPALKLNLSSVIFESSSNTFTVSSANDYSSLKNTTTVIKFDDKDWYLIDYDSSTVTLLSKECVGASAFGNNNTYNGSTVETFVKNWYTNNISANARTAVSDGKMFLLNSDQAKAMTADTRKCNQASGASSNAWWLCSPGGNDFIAACVYGFDGFVSDGGYDVNYTLGVRPALKLNLSSVIFSSNTFTVGSAASYSVTITPGSNMTKTTDSGAASQTDLSGAMTDVVYTADDRYYFPEDYSVAAVNGISVTRNSYTQITVSGTPTADAAITLTAPTAKTTPDAPTTAAAVNCTTASNNDGKLTGVTTAMEYKKSDAADWTAGTGSDITGLVPGTYYVRVKATDTTLASANQELTIGEYSVPTVAVTNVTLDKTDAQSIDVDGTVSFTATVSPDDATDKTVKWSVGGTDTDAVKLYSDQSCTTEVGTDATSTLTVYAKGISVGSATVTATSNADSNKSATCAVTVSKADPTAPTGLTATYGQKLSDVELTTGWTWADSTQSVGNVGNNTFKANFAGDDNYNAASNVDVTVTVSKAANPAIVTSTASVTKGGNTVDLANNVTKNGATGEVTYAIDGEANGCTLTGSTLISGANTGSVTVNVTVATDDNYEALAETTITVTISDKSTQTITASDVTATYGDTDKSVSATTNGDGAISYAVKDGSADYIDVNASTGALTIKKVGTATVTVTAAETSTYVAATKDVTVTIAKATPTVTAPTAKTLTYTGSAQELVNAGSATGGTMQYVLGSDATTAPTDGWGTSIPTGTDVGTYYVWYKVAEDANYQESTPAVITVTIADAPEDVVANLINNLPATANVTTENKADIEAARAAYNALTDDQKAKVSADTLKKLTDAEDALAAAQKETSDTASANAVSEKINALPAATAATTADKTAIEAARAAYNALTAEQKAKIPAETLKKLTDAEAALAAAQSVVTPQTEAQEKITITKKPSSLKAKVKKSKVTLSWKKIKKNKAGKKLLKQIKYIQIQYSTDPNFKENVKTKKVSKTKTKITLKLKRKTTYYIRIRYVGKDGYSNWSKVKTVKTK